MADYSQYAEIMLLKALQNNEEGAFTEIYDRYFEPLYRSAFKILQHKQGAEDAVQETFLSTWKYRKSIHIDNLGAYLHQSVRYAVIKEYRKNQTDGFFYKRLASASAILLQPDPLADKECQEKLLAILRTLPADQQSIYCMSREHAMTYQQIADKLQISVKTVEKKMSRSLHQFRNAFNHSLKFFFLVLTFFQ